MKRFSYWGGGAACAGGGAFVAGVGGTGGCGQRQQLLSSAIDASAVSGNVFKVISLTTCAFTLPSLPLLDLLQTEGLAVSVEKARLPFERLTHELCALRVRTALPVD